MVNDIKYYSQAGQDAWVVDLFKEQTNGFFVDIGAYDGVHLSNSYALEKLGWTGICIEANKKNFSKLLDNRKGAAYYINTAISFYNGHCCFNENDMYGSIGPGGTEIQCQTIENVLNLCKAPTTIDYLSIDIEGGEYNALRVFPFDKYFIKAITVEHNAYNSGNANKDAIYDLLTRNGFIRVDEVSADGLHFEDWYVHKNFTI